MGFRDKFDAAAPGPQSQSSGGSASDAYHALKSQLHQKLLELCDLETLEMLAPDLLQTEIAGMVDRLLQESKAVINQYETETIKRDIRHEMFGLGPLEQLMADPAVSDILVNRYDQIYVERYGVLERTSITFADEKHLLRILDKIVAQVGRRIDESSPMVDARLPDGSRLNAVIPPIALDGAMLSIRRFARIPLKMPVLVGQMNSLTNEMALVLEGLSKAKVNMLISGGTGTGKTTLLNILSGFIPASERIVTIEDAAELQLQQPHVVRLETRPRNSEGKGEITQRALVSNALRMRPDRIVIGEVRGAEVVDMLQAMNTGHEGSLTTVHANSPRDALSRLENMVAMANLHLPHAAVRQQIASAITVVIQLTRMSDGKRKVVSVQEITGMDGDAVSMQEIFAFRQTGIGASGQVEGRFHATGIRPKFAAHLSAFGVELPATLFSPTIVIV